MDATTAPVSGTELLFGGYVTDPDGVPVTTAVLTACGSRARTDAEGSFEVLAIGAELHADRIEVRVSAPGHEPLVTELVLGRDSTIWTAELTDGTRVVLRDFVLVPAKGGSR